MASSSNTTTDHKKIRAWAEERDGKPVTVRGTGDGESAGVLRFDFPGGAGADRLEEISWDDWFEKFDESGLALLYQDHKADGETSTFFKLIKREGADDDKDDDKPRAKAKAADKGDDDKDEDKPRAKKSDSKHDDDKDDDKKSDRAAVKAEKNDKDDHAKAEKNGHVTGHKAEAKKDDKDKKEHAKEREKAGAHAKK